MFQQAPEMLQRSAYPPNPAISYPTVPLIGSFLPAGTQTVPFVNPMTAWAPPTPWLPGAAVIDPRLFNLVNVAPIDPRLLQIAALQSWGISPQYLPLSIVRPIWPMTIPQPLIPQTMIPPAVIPQGAIPPMVVPLQPAAS